MSNRTNFRVETSFTVYLTTAKPTMRIGEFYQTVIPSEEVAVSFLRDHNLLDEVQDVDSCHKSSSTMQQKRKRDRGDEFLPVLRCPRGECQTSRSIRTGNRFFHCNDLNGKTNSSLIICEILELVYFFTIDIPSKTTIDLTGKSPNTVMDWYNMCQKVCGEFVSHRTRGQMISTPENPIQIDEARFAGRRKYNCGRLLNGDYAPETEDSDADVENNRNHDARIDGPWVFGLKNESDCRFFYVLRRDRATLLPIIQRECQDGSVIHSDEWPAYGCLNDIGYRHKTVNHQRNYVDSDSGAHT